VKPQKQAQAENLLNKIRELIKKEKYRFTAHAIERRVQRAISVQDTRHVLTHGFHEKGKTTFDERNKAWNYAIRGKTLDNKDLRIIVAIDEELIIITVIKVTKL
jgi:DNA-directed RNA polymerase subunit F